MGTQEIAELALKLDPAGRFELIDQILLSLDRPDPAIDRICQEEAIIRPAAHHAVKVQGIPAEEFFS